MLIKANNYDFEGAEKTYLTDPVTIGATSINVKDNQGFDQNEYIILGEIGTEKCEIVKVDAAVSAGTSLTITTAVYSHNEGDPVTYARYNQVRFYMATSSTGTYNLQTTVAMEVDNTSRETVWDDTDGVSTNYYKVSYYNDVTTLESSLSDAIPGSGILTNTVRYITDEVLKEANDEGEQFTSRQEILDWMNDCQEDVHSRRRKWSFLARRAAGDTTASDETLTLSGTFSVTDLDKLDHLTYNLIDGTTDIIYRLRYVPLDEFDLLTEDTNASESDTLEIFTWDEFTDKIRLHPTPDTSGDTVLYLYYYKTFTELDSDGDTVEIPDERIYKYYCLQNFYNKKGDDKKMIYYSNKYEQAIAQLNKREIKQVGYPLSFRYDKNNVRRFYKY